MHQDYRYNDVSYPRNYRTWGMPWWREMYYDKLTSNQKEIILAQVREKARSKMLNGLKTLFFADAKQTHGNVTQAAKLTGIARESLQRIMKTHNLSSADFEN